MDVVDNVIDLCHWPGTAVSYRVVKLHDRKQTNDLSNYVAFYKLDLNK